MPGITYETEQERAEAAIRNQKKLNGRWREEIHSREYDHAHAWDEMQQDVSAWLDGADIG
jgi:hypothetical protein